MNAWKSATIRFMAKDKFLYAIELGNEVLEMEDTDIYHDTKVPVALFVIPGVKPLEDSEVFMLGSDDDLSWHMDGNDLIIDELPDPLPCDHALSFKIAVR